MALSGMPGWVPVLWVVIWSVSLSAVDVRTRRLPTPMVRWFAGGMIVLAAVEGTSALGRALLGAGVLAGMLRLAGTLGAGSAGGPQRGSHRRSGSGVGGGDVRLGVPLGAFVGLTAAAPSDAVIGALLVAGLAAILSLGQVAVRALVADRGSRRSAWREPLAFGPWLCLAALVVGTGLGG